MPVVNGGPGFGERFSGKAFLPTQDEIMIGQVLFAREFDIDLSGDAAQNRRMRGAGQRAQIHFTIVERAVQIHRGGIGMITADAWRTEARGIGHLIRVIDRAQAAIRPQQGFARDVAHARAEGDAQAELRAQTI